MKRLLFVLVILFILAACGGSPETVREPAVRRVDSGGSCTANEYKTEASAQMARLQALMTGIDLQDLSKVAQQKQQVEAILSDINSMKCRNAFPLKQETLEYSAHHFIDVLEHRESGDLAAMQTSINRMELNVTTFQDWSFDME